MVEPKSGNKEGGGRTGMSSMWHQVKGFCIQVVLKLHLALERVKGALMFDAEFSQV